MSSEPQRFEDGCEALRSAIASAIVQPRIAGGGRWDHADDRAVWMARYLVQRARALGWYRDV